jgi:hypothetical protein
MLSEHRGNAVKYDPPHRYATAYSIGLVFSWPIIFVVSWIYTIVFFGTLLGIGLGWVVAIAACVLCWLWPAFTVAGTGLGCWLLLTYSSSA